MRKFITSAVLILSTTSLSAATLNGFDATMYGFIRTSAIYSTGGLASFNNINMTAPTHAVAQTRSQDESSRLSFQTQQSRVGVNLKKGEKLSAKLEFDFVDFNKSSPTTQMVPRVRIAAVTYAWDNHKVIIGQDWDLYSPVSAYTYNYVGNFFLAGNTGFMRQQAQYLRTEGNWEIGGALGMAGNNPGTADSDLELSKSPSYAFRLTRKLDNGRVGISGIYARLHYDTNGESHDSYAGNAFYEQVFGKLGLKTEAYFGQNLANIGSLAIGKGTDALDVKEYGAHFSATYKLHEKHAVFGGIGMAKVDNEKDVAPFSLSATSSISNPGILSNFLARLGWEYFVSEDLSWISELSHYETESKLSASRNQMNCIQSLETGIQLRF